MNARRGEIAAPLGGSERRLRLTFEGLANVETSLGAGIVAVAERFSRRAVGTTEVTAVLREGLKGAGETMDEAALRAAVMELGFAVATRLAARVLAVGLGIDDTAAEGGEPQTPGEPAGAPPFPGVA